MVFATAEIAFIFYQDIIKNFAFNKMLHHVGMLWIIENHENV